MKKLLIVALLIPAIANAGFFSGNALLSRMNSSENIERAVSLGYVVGVFDAYENITHCNSPANITSGQIRDIVKKYIEENPATRDRNAELLIATAFGQIWPCAKSPTGKGT